MSGFSVTKKMIRDAVAEFVENKMDVFSRKKRGMNAIEDKTIDVLYGEVLKARPTNHGEAVIVAEEFLKCAVERADALGFTKIIYDFILMCAEDH